MMDFWKKQSSNVKLIILLLIVLAIILAAFFVVKLGKENNDVEAIQPEETKEEKVVLNTPAGKLNYPSERARYARIDEDTDGTSYTATIYGEVGGKEFKLFSIYTNEQVLESFLIGNITDENGNTYSVSMVIEELEAEDGWNDTTDEEKDLIYAMQEDVNYIVEQIEALPGFTPAY